MHIPLARQIPGLTAFNVGHCAALDKSEPAYYWVATLDFATGSVTMFSQQLDDVLTAR